MYDHVHHVREYYKDLRTPSRLPVRVACLLKYAGGERMPMLIAGLYTLLRVS
jgi:hypothetical protein